MTAIRDPCHDDNMGQFRKLCEQIVELEDQIRICPDPLEAEEELRECMDELHVLYEHLFSLWPVQEGCGTQEEEASGHNQGSD